MIVGAVMLVADIGPSGIWTANITVGIGIAMIAIDRTRSYDDAEVTTNDAHAPSAVPERD